MLDRIGMGMQRAGRTRQDFELVVAPLCATGDTATEVSAQREKHREILATNLSTPQYWPTLELHGWRATGERLRELWREGHVDLMAAQINDEMLEVLMPSAPWTHLARVLRERFEGLAQGICLPLPVDAKHDATLGRVIRELQE